MANHSKRAMPADFRDRAHGLTIEQARRIWGCGNTVAARWFADAGFVPRDPRAYKTDAPEDFAKLAPTMFVYELAAHYQVAEATVRRWKSLTGVRSQVYVARKGQAYLKRPALNGSPTLAGGLEERAANHLRRVTRAFISRKRDGWLYGNTPLTGDELLARAEAKGFSWGALAA